MVNLKILNKVSTRNTVKKNSSLGPQPLLTSQYELLLGLQNGARGLQLVAHMVYN
jgi:hypothetical protein